MIMTFGFLHSNRGAAYTDGLIADLKKTLNSPGYISLIEKKRNPTARLQSAAGLRLLTETLKRIGVDVDGLRVGVGENGRPCLPDRPDIDFNISHTRELVVCAAATDTRVGIDTEGLPLKNGIMLIAPRFFTENEQQYLRSQPSTDAAFARIWTRKEAFFKYTGKGFSEAPSKTDVFALEDDGIVTFEEYALVFNDSSSFLINLCHDASLASTAQIEEINLYC